jgi:branched-chain amino acid transport system ATP-binding protein
MTGNPALLQVAKVSAGYRRIQVLHDVSLHVGAGEFVTVVGSNGAGKSTLMKVLTGLLPATGTMRLENTNLLELDPHRRVAAGIGYVPEGRRVFPALTVAENLKVACRARGEALSAELDRIYDMFPKLRERHDQLAGTLSGGEQQMLAMGRALISRPRLLLADEISLGLAPLVVESLFEVLREATADGMSILLAEQNATMALEFSDRAYVMETGRITLEGRSAELASDERVINAYLQMV